MRGESRASEKEKKMTESDWRKMKRGRDRQKGRKGNRAQEI